MSTNYLRYPRANAQRPYRVFKNGVMSGHIWSESAKRAQEKAQEYFPDVIITVKVPSANETETGALSRAQYRASLKAKINYATQLIARYQEELKTL